MQKLENDPQNSGTENNEPKISTKPKRRLKFLLFLFSVIVILGVARIYYGISHEEGRHHPEPASASHESGTRHAEPTSASSESDTHNPELDSGSRKSNSSHAETSSASHEMPKQVQHDQSLYPTKTPNQVQPDIHGFNNYRYYLWNFSLLINNFLQDKDFSSQIVYMINHGTKLNMPPTVNTIITQLQDYNNTYLVKESPPLEVFPQKPGWLEKLIKIQKHPANLHSKRQLKTEISENLESIINFLYSEEAQQQFTGKNEEPIR